MLVLKTMGLNPFDQVETLLMDGFKKVSDLWPKLVRRTCRNYIKEDRIDSSEDHDGSWGVDVDESSSSENEDEEEKGSQSESEDEDEEDEETFFN